MNTEKNMHKVLVSVRGHRHSNDRMAYAFALRRPENAPMVVALDQALELGLVQYGTTNASARAWSARWVDGLLYLTKAGRAWLKTRGAELDREEAAEFSARLAAARARIEAAKGVVG